MFSCSWTFWTVRTVSLSCLATVELVLSSSSIISIVSCSSVVAFSGVLAKYFVMVWSSKLTAWIFVWTDWFLSNAQILPIGFGFSTGLIGSRVDWPDSLIGWPTCSLPPSMAIGSDECWCRVYESVAGPRGAVCPSSLIELLQLVFAESLFCSSW